MTSLLGSHYGTGSPFKRMLCMVVASLDVPGPKIVNELDDHERL